MFVVNYSPAFRWSLALLLPLTLVWKLAAAPDTSLELKDELVEFLIQSSVRCCRTRRVDG